MTQKIDITKPLELDDGTPVEFRSSDAGGVLVKLPPGSSHRRDGTGWADCWWYKLSDGTFRGGTNIRHYSLRNTQENPAVLKVGDKVYHSANPSATGVVIAANDERIVIEGARYGSFVSRNPDGTCPEGYAAWIKQPEKPEQVVKYSALLTLTGMAESDKGAGGRTAAIGFDAVPGTVGCPDDTWSGTALKTTYENDIPVAVELVTKP